MKKRVFFAMILTAAAGLTACGNDLLQAADMNAANAGATQGNGEIIRENDALYNDIAEEDGAICEGNYWTDEDLPVSMRTEQSAYLPDIDVITATVTNNTDDVFAFPADQFTLGMLQNGRAIPLPYKEGGDAFNDLAGIIEPHETGTVTFHIA